MSKYSTIGVACSIEVQGRVNRKDWRGVGGRGEGLARAGSREAWRVDRKEGGGEGEMATGRGSLGGGNGKGENGRG